MVGSRGVWGSVILINYMQFPAFYHLTGCYIAFSNEFNDLSNAIVYSLSALCEV